MNISENMTSVNDNGDSRGPNITDINFTITDPLLDEWIKLHK